MPRLDTPNDIADAPAAAQENLTDLKRAFGSVPNLFRIISNSPAALDGYVNFSGALARGTLDAATRERIALAVAEINGCDYCLAAHSFIAQTSARLTSAEINSNRKGGSTDVKADAAVRFAVAIAKDRGQVDDALFDELASVGYTPSDIVEIIAHVALNTFTNYINDVLGTEIDFPVARSLAA